MKCVWYYLAGVSLLFAQEKAPNIDLQELLEKKQAEYWKYREETIRLRKQMEQEYKLVETDLKSMYQAKNNIQEEYYLVKEVNDRWKNKKSELSEYLNLFSTRVSDVIALESKKLRAQYPGTVQESIAHLSKCEHLLATNLREAAIQVAEYKRWIIGRGESIEVFQKNISLGENPSELIKGLRVGYIFQGLVGSNSTFSTVRISGVAGPSYKEILLIGPLGAKISSSVLDSYVANPQENKEILVPIDVAQVGERILNASGDTASSKLFLISYFVQLFRDGGILMLPLFLVALVALYIAVMKFVFFYKNRVVDVSSLVEKVLESARKKDWQHARTICAQNNFVSRMFLDILSAREELSSKKLDADTSDRIFIQAISKEISGLNAGLSTLAVLAAVAPLMGLLGTVAGMIQLFDVITVYGSNNPKILAGGISVALITTQAGLAIAVPIMLTHHVLVRFKTKSSELLESVGLKLLSVL